MRVLAPNEYNKEIEKMEFPKDFSVWAVDHLLLDSHLQYGKEKNMLRLKRTDIRTKEGVEETIFTSQRIGLEKNRDHSFVELVIYRDQSRNMCSFFFRNEKGVAFQKNRQFGWRRRKLTESPMTPNEKFERDQGTAFELELEDDDYIYAMDEKTGPLKRNGREWILKMFVMFPKHSMTLSSQRKRNNGKEMLSKGCLTIF
jgi:hypothetical protein